MDSTLMSMKWEAPRFTIRFEDLTKDSYFNGEIIQGKVVLFVRMFETPLEVTELTKCELQTTTHPHYFPEGYHKLPFDFEIKSTLPSYLQVQVNGDYDFRWTKSKTKLKLGLDADPDLLYHPGIIRPYQTSHQDIPKDCCLL